MFSSNCRHIAGIFHRTMRYRTFTLSVEQMKIYYSLLVAGEIVNSVHQMKVQQGFVGGRFPRISCSFCPDQHPSMSNICTILKNVNYWTIQYNHCKNTCNEMQIIFCSAHLQQWCYIDNYFDAHNFVHRYIYIVQCAWYEYSIMHFSPNLMTTQLYILHFHINLFINGLLFGRQPVSIKLFNGSCR